MLTPVLESTGEHSLDSTFRTVKIRGGAYDEGGLILCSDPFFILVLIVYMCSVSSVFASGFHHAETAAAPL